MDPTQMSPNAPLGPPPPGQTSDFGHPVDQQRYDQMLVSLAIVYPVSTLCVLLRIWTRGFIVKQLGWDDAFALIGMLLNIGSTVEFVGVTQAGLADYDWNVRAMQWLAQDDDSYEYWNSVGSILFYLCYAFIKTSILLLYLRVLGGTHHRVRWGIYGLIFLVWAGVISCMIAVLCFCSPPAKLFHPHLAGTCNVHTNVFFAQALISVITDILILVPPIPIIWNLRASSMKKIGLVLVLCLGLVVTGIALTRAISWDTPVVYFLFDNYYGVYWAMMEVNFALIAVCLPALSQLFMRYRRKATHQSSGSPPGAPTAVPPAMAAATAPPTSLEDCGYSAAVVASPATARNPSDRRKRSPLSQFMHGFHAGLGHSQAEGDCASRRNRGNFGNRESVDTEHIYGGRPIAELDPAHHEKCVVDKEFPDDGSYGSNSFDQGVGPQDVARMV